VVSDRSARGERPDMSGPALAEALRSYGWQVGLAAIVPDEEDIIAGKLVEWADGGEIDIILTTGGTGFALRDVTPEATLQVLERQAPGLAEAMRLAGSRVTPHAMLSRGVAGMRGRVLIVNLPGSPKAAVENLQAIQVVLPHAVELLADFPQSEAHHSDPRRRPRQG